MSTTGCEGESITFTIEVSGNNLAYQWSKDENDIEDATESIFVIDNIEDSDTGDYACIISNGSESLTSESATLIVHTNIEIISQPEPVDLKAGETAQFIVEVTDTITSHQWYKENIALTDGDNIAGTQTSTLSISNVSMDDEGMYKCEINGACSDVTSEEVTLSINTAVKNIKELGIEIGPNPSTDVIFIKNGNFKIKELKFINSQGKIVKTLFNDFDQISVFELPAGVYILLINSNNEEFYTTKVLVQ